MPLADYLYRRYPVGIPVDALDVDVTDQFDGTDFVPAITAWGVISAG